MNNRLLLSFVVILSAISTRAGESSLFAELDRFVGLPPILPPLGVPRENWVKNSELAFAKRLGLSEENFAKTIIDYYKTRKDGNDTNNIHKVLLILSDLTDTNTVPFVRSILIDKVQKEYWGAALYILARRGSEEDFGWFQRQLSSDWLDEGLRTRFYQGCCTRLGWEVEHPAPYPSFKGNPCYDALKEALEIESSLNTRMQIDTMFDYSLKGWRTSDERENLLRRWLAESEGQDINRVVGDRLKRLAKARKKGDTMVVCERPHRKDPSPEEVERQKKKAAEERAARMQTPYEGPLVIDMDELDEQ